MNLTITTAISGLTASSARLESAARAVAGADLSDVSGGAAKTGPAGRPAVAGAPFAAPFTGMSGHDFAAGLVDAKRAEIGYKASAAVLAAAVRLEDELLEILA